MSRKSTTAAAAAIPISFRRDLRIASAPFGGSGGVDVHGGG